MNKNTAGFLLVLFFTAPSLSGCSTAKKELYASPAPDAGFIKDPERQTDLADLPFNKEWIKPGFDKSKYNTVIIAPVNTTHMLAMNWWQQTNLRSVGGQYQEDVKEVARYMHHSFTKAVKEDPKQRFGVVSQPKGQTLQLELALIELVPSKPVLNALGWVGPWGSGTAASVISPRTVAFEGRLRDAQTGEIVATFADREKQEAGPIDLTRLTWYEPAKHIMDEWAKQMVQIANRKPGEAVEKPIPFTLMPW